MKTTLFITLLVSVYATTKAQDFQAVPPDQRPNAAELARFGSKNPNEIARRPGLEEQQDKEAVALVTGFLTELANDRLEAAHKLIAEGFVAYGPGYNDTLETNDLINGWTRNGKLFVDQHLTVESSSVTTVPTGSNRGTWVYLKMVWSATERSERGKPVRIPFHQLARVNNGLIERTYTSYGNDQIFYDLGNALYASPSGVGLRR